MGIEAICCWDELNAVKFRVKACTTAATDGQGCVARGDRVRRRRPATGITLRVRTCFLEEGPGHIRGGGAGCRRDQDASVPEGRGRCQQRRRGLLIASAARLTSPAGINDAFRFWVEPGGVVDCVHFTPVAAAGSDTVVWLGWDEVTPFTPAANRS